MKKKILSLLVLLAAAVTGAWAQNVLNLVVDGTSATIMYDGNASNNPILSEKGWQQNGNTWDMDYTNRSTITTVTIDGSCKNFSGTKLRSLFNSFSVLTTINGLENLNTATVQNMEYMFASCSSLTSLDLSSLNTASVTTMFYMFGNCSKLTSLDLSSWNTENVETTNSLFSGCSELTTVDLSGWNTAKLWNTCYMFCDCSKLENIYVGDGWSTEAVTSSDDMFDGCTKLLSLNTANPATDKTNAHTGDGGYLKVKPAFDYELTVAPCEHGSGTISYTVQDKDDAEKITENAKGANEGDKVTVAIAPDEGWWVDPLEVTAEVYRYWEGSRRAQATVPMQRTVDLDYKGKDANGVATYTFTMPASNVKVKGAYKKSSTLYFDPADKTNLMEVKNAGIPVNLDENDKTVKIDKVEDVIEGTPVKLTANPGYKFRKVEVKKGPAIKTITIEDVVLVYEDGDTWEKIKDRNPGKVVCNTYVFIKGRVVLLNGPVTQTAVIVPDGTYTLGAS